ncbi:response regulator [Legionella bononiensis]|uniref:histidine kinase n=1 Tax=Legionella bononiensis TaxID=2793102 RepID=A0ABS1WDZ5_9GAMM|nr:response regulator [Legionella bononiensis]MBL7479551.1 response regulator [Legionella bononiensis]MBL7527575.1 response regulator [Legionella bononiensis]
MPKKPFVSNQDPLQKRLRELEEELSFYHDMMNYIPGHIYWLDQNNRYLGCNQEHAKNIGLSNRLDIIGKTNHDMPWKDIAETVNQTNKEVMRTGEPVTIKETGLINGIQTTFLSQKVPLKNKNKEIVGILGISINITEIEQLQKSLIEAKKDAEAASQAKTEFLENMRHDIRTPLTGIVGFADLLKMESDNPLIKEYSENLVASSHALLDLLDEVLEAIRVSSGEIPKLKKKFNLEHALNHVIELNRAKAAQKKLALSLKFDDHIPHYVIGDKVRIHRVALELVANALNFTDSGHVTLSAVLAKRHQRELVIKLIIEDSGIGIPKDKQQEIYVQFKRLTPSYQGIYKGAGLGLAVVKQFIDELGGEIYVESESRKGSRFTCVIPLQEPLLDDDLGINEELEELMNSPYEKTYAQEIKPVCPDNTQQHHQVLVVEDNLIAQIVANSILSKLNCSIDIAETGKTALEYWKSHHYDLIFMDIGLPDMDGYEVTHLIRVHELSKKTHTPIIALTAHAGDENKKRCIDAGMNAVLTKPLTAVNCADIIDAFIPGKSQEAADKNAFINVSELPEHHEALFDLSSFPIFSEEEGIKTTGNKATLEQMLVFMVEDSLPNDLQLMKEAHDNLDWDKTQHLAHKIKGGAVYVGTVQLKMACQYLERYYKSGQREQLEPLYQQVLKVIDQTIKEIVKYLKK